MKRVSAVLVMLGVLALVLAGCAGRAQVPPDAGRADAVSKAVPSVVGLSVGQAVTTLARDGFRVRLVETGEGQSAVTVRAQAPTGRVESDLATVTLTVDAWTEGADQPDLQDAAPNKDATFYALVVMSSDSEQEVRACLGAAQRYAQAPFVAPVVDESDHYTGLPAGKHVLLGGFENEIMADRQAQDLVELGFDARTTRVTKTCDDPIEINQDFPDI